MTAVDEFFDPLAPDVIGDPYPAYRRLRRHDPVYWHRSLESWILTGYDACARVLRDSATYAADFRRVGFPTPAPLLSLQTLDPPEQTPLRQFAIKALHAQDLDALEADAAGRARRELRALAGKGGFDFVRDFAEPFTLRTISTLLGAEPPGGEAFERRNEDLDRSMDAGLEPESEEAGLRARAEFSALVDSWLAAGPTEGILGYVAAHRDEARVPHDVLVNSVRAFWHAGFEVPSRFMGNVLLAVLRDPSLLEGARRAASLDLAVGELARLVGPVHAVSRACTRATRLGAHTIAKGAIVVAVLAAANRDPAVFERPDEAVLSRAPNPHLAFGKGAHACLGFAVGKMQVRVVLAELLDSYGAMELTGDPVPRHTATLRGLHSLPVRLQAPQPALA